MTPCQKKKNSSFSMMTSSPRVPTDTSRFLLAEPPYRTYVTHDCDNDPRLPFVKSGFKLVVKVVLLFLLSIISWCINFDDYDFLALIFNPCRDNPSVPLCEDHPSGVAHHHMTDQNRAQSLQLSNEPCQQMFILFC